MCQSFFIAIQIHQNEYTCPLNDRVFLFCHQLNGLEEIVFYTLIKCDFIYNNDIWKKRTALNTI